MGASVLAAVFLLALSWAALAQPAALPAAAAARAAEYRLGAGDVLRVQVFQNPELTLETRVGEAGSISYPLIGAVRVGGQTISGTEKLIADALRSGGFVRDPQVTVSVLQVRGNQVNVLGQVNRPGRYPLEVADTRLSDMLALAGGAAPAGADLVVVTGMRDGRPFRVEVDLPALFAPGGAQADLLLQNGDSVWVDRQPVVYIYGEVQRPGPMRLERGMTLMQALATGGGLTPRGTDKGIKVHRRQGEGGQEVVEPALQDRLRDGDVIFVRESLF